MARLALRFVWADVRSTRQESDTEKVKHAHIWPHGRDCGLKRRAVGYALRDGGLVGIGETRPLRIFRPD